jgi:Ran GTPase-activating protein (RanGAP) involved in mRNA processing and transport
MAFAIKVNSTLQNINLSRNSIGNKEAKWIAEAIKINSTLQKIELAFNDIKDEGAKRIANAVEMNFALEMIGLVCNDIEYGGAKCIADAMKKNYSLQRAEFCFEPYPDLQSQVSALLKENVLRKKCSVRKLLCAFSETKKDLIRLRFDKMILNFVYAPIIEGHCIQYYCV